MTNYSKGKIYKIVVNNTDEEYRPYIGSTTKEYLSQRFVQHRNVYSRYKNGKTPSISSFKLFDKYGIENCEIILLENYPCASKDELRSRERHWFDNIENCNIVKPALTEEEISNLGKIRYKKKIELHPDYNQKHYQRKLELHPDYNQKHYQRKLELHPDYKKNRTEGQKEARKEKYTCMCGSHIRREQKSKHNKSKKHLDYIAMIAIQQEV